MITEYNTIKEKNNSSLKELKEKIDNLKYTIKEQSQMVLDKKKEIDDFEPDHDSCIDKYDDMLDKIYGKINIAGFEYQTSYALEETDPITYGCGLNDFVYSLKFSEFSEYTDLEDDLETLEDDLETLEDDLETLEDDLDDMYGC